jgi:penicillin-binding protein-related factor A (putative recombinase)
MGEQLQLAGVNRREPQGNRGRIWQDILDRTHAWYESRRWGKVYSVRNEWAFADRWLWEKQTPECRARTAEGGLLMRRKSAPDYVGSVGCWAVQFDAKEFAGASISYENFKPKQIEDLYSSFAGGNPYSGFMVLEKRTMNVYWVQADWAYIWHTNVKRAMPGVVKSINFSKVVDGRIRVLGRCDGYRFHYAPALIGGFAGFIDRKAA